MMGDNYGIQHSGSGNVSNSGVQAFGPHAKAVGQPAAAAPEAVTTLIAELRRLVRESELPDQRRAEAGEQLDVVAAQLDTGGPDGNIVYRALARLSTAVGSVAALATHAESLWQAVEQLMR